MNPLELSYFNEPLPRQFSAPAGASDVSSGWRKTVAPTGAACSCRALSQGFAGASPWANIWRPYRGWKPPKSTPWNYWPGSGWSAISKSGSQGSTQTTNAT